MKLIQQVLFTLICSLEGMSRSVTVVLAHLMKSDQLSVDEAVAFMKKIYPKAK